MPTLMPKESEIERKWVLVDAQGKVLGRLASRVASILRGKHKPTFAPHLDVGDHVVVVNAEKVHLTGRKLRDKQYRWHSGYIGGLREVSAETMLRTHPERVIEWAVQGMLPKNRLGRAMAKKLKVYRGAAHPHQAQQPVPMSTTAEGR
ncbi:MAG: 50S ribosomal protein L13 [Candidatus Rokubacteria bacterium]|nr:50S ribosomal protein L13 [Candidatus Rokubacteria bacterium]MBI2155812.1 50S ribosomal protein L13 [Candidatus Rokubacteria bacterium]MBI2491711.1 50S ribosomal protein L13 [Candidatus Rokubacteria bacterium]MBI4629798.1 50S ribosomal protein L13 [Candidatus Rokubacteria bacterium]